MKARLHFRTRTGWDNRNCSIDVGANTQESTTHFLRHSPFPADVLECSVSLTLPADEAWTLTSGRNLEHVRSTVVPPFPVGRFVVVRIGDTIFKYDFPWAAQFRITKELNEVRVDALVGAASSCGYGMHHRMTGWRPESVTGLAVVRNRLPALGDCIWIEPYPRGAPAAVCLTDHADFDTVSKIGLISDLFRENHIRITKSVFPAADPTPGKDEPGMDTHRYRDIIEGMSSAGCEVAYHGFGPRRDAPPTSECRRRAGLMAELKVETWIDHGSGDYLFANRGVLTDGTPLEKFLEDYGVRNYWSYWDTWDNPLCGQSIWSKRGIGRIVAESTTGRFRLSPRTASQHAYVAMHGMKSLIGVKAVKRLRRGALSPVSWIRGSVDARRVRKIYTRPVVVYTREGLPIFAADNPRTTIFDTTAVNHLAVQLARDQMDELIEGSGLLLGHCYLGVQHRYIAGGCFVTDNGKVRIDARFRHAIEYIAQRQRDGAIATMPYNQLRQCLETAAGATLTRTKTGWIVQNAYGHDVVIGGAAEVVRGLTANGAAHETRGGVGILTLSAGGTSCEIVSVAEHSRVG